MGGTPPPTNQPTTSQLSLHRFHLNPQYVARKTEALIAKVETEEEEKSQSHFKSNSITPNKS